MMRTPHSAVFTSKWGLYLCTGPVRARRPCWCRH